QDGVERRTIIDLGGGTGAKQHELMARGAAGGTHSDAAPAFLRAARSEAEARGYAERIRYVDGDFVERARELPAADLVTLDRVVCCYPDMPALLGAAAPLAKRVLGLVMPHGGPLARFGVGLVNFIQRLRRHPFRVFAHEPSAVEAVVESYGLVKRFERAGVVWRVLVFTRPEAGRP
ncbi:MAG: class I SAM-dependent methyltransferase, partial [Gammaproteobacteria bacterium]|nr:class I SAM-dependent methyltransferase [Gammaproteobacteria bacterium]